MRLRELPGDAKPQLLLPQVELPYTVLSICCRKAKSVWLRAQLSASHISFSADSYPVALQRPIQQPGSEYLRNALQLCFLFSFFFGNVVFP